MELNSCLNVPYSFYNSNYSSVFFIVSRISKKKCSFAEGKEERVPPPKVCLALPTDWQGSYVDACGKVANYKRSVRADVKHLQGRQRYIFTGEAWLVCLQACNKFFIEQSRITKLNNGSIFTYQQDNGFSTAWNRQKEHLDVSMCLRQES